MTMAQVFLSYAREDIDRARALAEALGAAGIPVWWDRAITPGRQFAELIEERLREARCAIVLWSKASVTSKWVNAEATEADDRHILIPVLIERDVKPPMIFRRLHAADLSEWNGEPDDAAFREVLAAVRALLPAGETGRTSGDGPGTGPPVGPTEPGEKRTGGAGLKQRAVVGLAAIVLLGGIGLLVSSLEWGRTIVPPADTAAVPIVGVESTASVLGNPPSPVGSPAPSPQPTQSPSAAPPPAASGTPVNPGAGPGKSANPATFYMANRTITGTVTSEATGQPIAGAMIVLDGTSVGTTTRGDGTFSISVPRSEVTLLVRFVGYQATRVSVPPGTGGVAVRMR